MNHDRNKLQGSIALAVLAVAEAALAVASKSYFWLGLAGALFAMAAITYASSKRQK